jgi:alpha-glucosidase
VVAFVNNGVAVVANTGTKAVALPEGELLHASGPLEGASVPGDTTAWVKLAR